MSTVSGTTGMCMHPPAHTYASLGTVEWGWRRTVPLCVRKGEQQEHDRTYMCLRFGPYDIGVCSMYAREGAGGQEEGGGTYLGGLCGALGRGHNGPLLLPHAQQGITAHWLNGLGHDASTVPLLALALPPPAPEGLLP